MVNEIAHEICYDKDEERKSRNKWESKADATYTLRNPYAPSSSLRDIGAQSGLNGFNIAEIPEFLSCGENSNHLDSFADFD